LSLISKLKVDFFKETVKFVSLYDFCNEVYPNFGFQGPLQKQHPLIIEHFDINYFKFGHFLMLLHTQFM
jgi:hypothetical protein